MEKTIRIVAPESAHTRMPMALYRIKRPGESWHRIRLTADEAAYIRCGIAPQTGLKIEKVMQ